MTLRTAACIFIAGLAFLHFAMQAELEVPCSDPRSLLARKIDHIYGARAHVANRVQHPLIKVSNHKQILESGTAAILNSLEDQFCDVLDEELTAAPSTST